MTRFGESFVQTTTTTTKAITKGVGEKDNQTHQKGKVTVHLSSIKRWRRADFPVQVSPMMMNLKRRS
jgi:hypothetical protein